jgi:hypothetical protein
MTASSAKSQYARALNGGFPADCESVMVVVDGDGAVL